MKQITRPILFAFVHIEEVIVVLCMIGIAVLTFLAVLTRYVFSFSIIGADEMATFMFLWAALFGAAAGFKYNQHGSVPLLANLLPRGARRVADLLVLLVMAGFFLFLTWYTWLFLAQSYRVGQTSPATGIPVWIVNAGIFVALGLCSLRCLIAVVRDLSGRLRYPNMPRLPE
ncbi:TRAP transporter small permease [Pusillimonas sp. ANT_WB101]|uniref:TRAP transporter small permease n=1 Tax=Pusillimonas sp. ANT_WB101 TaxID=2597356 RepID=UPI0011EE5EDE|nr:TRAP transporter small permease [Pusillimonas sp. ANT_WB101]KAA0892632.1 TRAP transporter small permease [Pusillimonas sp. ANT_WB101]